MADIYRSMRWSGSDMWLRLPNRLNVLFIVQLPDSLENSLTIANVYLRISIAFIFTKFLNNGYLCTAILIIE